MDRTEKNGKWLNLYCNRATMLEEGVNNEREQEEMMRKGKRLTGVLLVLALGFQLLSASVLAAETPQVQATSWAVDAGLETMAAPAAVKLSSVKNISSKSIKVTWKKQSGVTGYQVQYSTSSKMKSAKTVTVKKAATTSVTISKLKKGKKYYVRVRTYKKVNGVKYYSGWSKAKTVTTKKPASKPSTGGSSTRVYITETGARYHYNYNCRGLSNARRKIPTTLSKAKAQGYTLCGYEK